MDEDTVQNDLLLGTSRLFLAGGLSALFLSIAHTHQVLWFLSLFALVPYLWKLKRTGFWGSILLGAIFAVCFSFVVFIENILLSPIVFIARLSILISIFSLFGITFNRIKKSIGFYPVFIAALWIPLEYFLIRWAGIEGVLNFPYSGSNLLIRFASLFGLLTVSFFIMLINFLILLLLELVIKIRFSGARFKYCKSGATFRPRENFGLAKPRNFLPNFRGPPAIMP